MTSGLFHEVLSLRPVRMNLADAYQLVFTLRALDVQSDAAAGVIVWQATAGAGATVGLAFPWAVLECGGAVIADVTAIHTNLEFEEPAGCVTTQLRRAARAASLIHRLRWESAVEAQLQSPSRPGPVSH